MTDRLERLTLQAMATRLGLHIGARINQAREEAGLATQQALADLLPSPISNQYISKWEKGVKPLDKNLKLIAEALGKPVGWFYEGFEQNGTTPDPFSANDNGHDDAPTLTAIHQAISDMRDEARKLDVALRAMISAWPGSGKKKFSQEDGLAVLAWLNAGGTAPRSEDEEGRQGEAG